jgi:energy-coupling factor transporter ATP-binding protein EcfA2
MIHVSNLSVYYGTSQVLQDICFHVNPGECLVITGSSGCGKSTLARVLTGIIPNAIATQIEGTVTVLGMDILHTPVADVAGQVGIVFQNPCSHLFHLRVDDEVAFGPRNLGYLKMNFHPCRLGIGCVWGLSELRDHKPANLSGGQIQRLAIAAALAIRPRVIVLDEPTASLDVPGTQNVITTLEKLKKQFGLTIVLIEHRLAEVRRLADRVIVMDEGRIVAQGWFDDVLGDQEILHQYGLRRPTAESLTDWSKLLIPNDHHPQGQRPLLDLQNITAGYDGQAIIHDIDLKIFPGEFVALVGDNGSVNPRWHWRRLVAQTHQRKDHCEWHGSSRPGLMWRSSFKIPPTNCLPIRWMKRLRSVHVIIVSSTRTSTTRLLSVPTCFPSERVARSRYPSVNSNALLASCIALRPHLSFLMSPRSGRTGVTCSN